MKDIGLFKKYEVKKISNPDKKVDGIVLEFDDELSRKAIRQVAMVMFLWGYSELASDLLDKCDEYEGEKNE